MGTIACLDDNLVSRVLSFLGWKDLLTLVPLVCTTWKRLAAQPLLRDCAGKQIGSRSDYTWMARAAFSAEAFKEAERQTKLAILALQFEPIHSFPSYRDLSEGNVALQYNMNSCRFSLRILHSIAETAASEDAMKKIKASNKESLTEEEIDRLRKVRLGYLEEMLSSVTRETLNKCNEVIHIEQLMLERLRRAMEESAEPGEMNITELNPAAEAEKEMFLLRAVASTKRYQLEIVERLRARDIQVFPEWEESVIFSSEEGPYVQTDIDCDKERVAIKEMYEELMALSAAYEAMPGTQYDFEPRATNALSFAGFLYTHCGEEKRAVSLCQETVKLVSRHCLGVDQEKHKTILALAQLLSDSGRLWASQIDGVQWITPEWNT